MEEILVDEGQMNSSAGRMRSVASDVQTLVGSLQAAAQSAASGWQGSSAASFLDMWNRWKNAMEQLTAAIEQTGQHLDQAAVLYEETDRTAVQLP